MHLREARFSERSKFRIADLQIGMQSALQQNAGAPSCSNLFDFLVDGFKERM